MTELEKQARAILGLGEDEPLVLRLADGSADIRWPNGVKSDRVLMSAELFEDLMASYTKAARADVA